MNKKIILIILQIVFILTSVVGQNKIIVRGKVTDNNEPLPGVTVVELDKNNRIQTGATTNLDGEYVIFLKNKDSKLQFSFIGYKSQTIEVNGKSKIDVTLLEDVKTLESINIVADAVTNTGFMKAFTIPSTIAVTKAAKKLKTVTPGRR